MSKEKIIRLYGSDFYELYFKEQAIEYDQARAKAISEGNSYNYAFYVDKYPRDDTRAGAIREGNGYFYARYVDKRPRDDTRARAIAEEPTLKVMVAMLIAETVDASYDEIMGMINNSRGLNFEVSQKLREIGVDL